MAELRLALAIRHHVVSATTSFANNRPYSAIELGCIFAQGSTTSDTVEMPERINQELFDAGFIFPVPDNSVIYWEH
jgi:hypothetical protein